MPTHKQQRRRALELLEASIDGCTEAIMLAYGFKTEVLVELVNAELATSTIERMVIGGRGVKVVRMRITAAGRRALSKLRWPWSLSADQQRHRCHSEPTVLGHVCDWDIAEFLGWLVKKRITPHIPLWDMSECITFRFRLWQKTQHFHLPVGKKLTTTGVCAENFIRQHKPAASFAGVLPLPRRGGRHG
jgi:hypothetical protein